MLFCPMDGKLESYCCPCCGDSMEAGDDGRGHYCNKCDQWWKISPIVDASEVTVAPIERAA